MHDLIWIDENAFRALRFVLKDRAFKIFTQLCDGAGLADCRKTLVGFCRHLYVANVIRSDNEPLFKYLAKRAALVRVWRFVAPYSPFSNGICARIMASVRTFVVSTKDWPANRNAPDSR